jgi:hypothetical protein
MSLRTWGASFTPHGSTFGMFSSTTLAEWGGPIDDEDTGVYHKAHSRLPVSVPLRLVR